ncbi:histone-fold-containing protein [Pyrenochaeta sp. MPI-SDFR-AT-0127]|nr:histone-fold-containing protein [Pyrenochaeta sp. MPI-SDFR-AT-0127]
MVRLLPLPFPNVLICASFCSHLHVDGLLQRAFLDAHILPNRAFLRRITHICNCREPVGVAVYLKNGQCAASDMSSSSPQSSTSPPQSTPKSTSSNASTDANIRNFAPVARIMKMALPENAKIAKEAKECMQECVSEFISFITSEASEKCQQEKRKTVNGEDILFAMTSLGFENYSEALKIYLSRYRETLLANQNKPPTGQFNAAGASGPNAGGAENQQHVLSGDSEMAEDGGTAFGYTVHNGNGSADY